MTHFEIEKEIRELRTMLDLVYFILYQAPGTFIYSQAWDDDCTRALDWCEVKIRKLLAC